MHLAEIKVSGFRNLKSVVVSLDSGLNVLVGANNVGKTNLLDALRVAVGSTAATDGIPVHLDRDDFFRTKQDEGPGGPIRIDLVFRDLTKAQIARFHELAEPNLADLAQTTASLHFESVWDDTRGRATHQRWGGSENRERAAVSMDTLQALPVTFLPALRDAAAALTPGYRNRIAHLFRDRIARMGKARAEIEQEAMVAIYEAANDQLLDLDVVKAVRVDLTESVKSMAGNDYVEPTVAAAPPEYHRILRSLCLGLADGPIADIGRSGLGYSNLLYIGAVLTHLTHAAEGDQPILVVEEPEAHLHPQLVQLLARRLQTDAKDVQTLVSTHSPSLAASIDPRRVRPMFREAANRVQIGSLQAVGMNNTEARQLERMMDLTRASLLFARAAILVEGVSESLLIPALAARMGIDLRALHVSVIPIAGVAFKVFKKLLGESGLQIPVAIISDSDPPLKTTDADGKKVPWDAVLPELENGVPKCSARAERLREAFEEHPTVKVFTAAITLEHELAAAGAANPRAMVSVWEAMFERTPRTLNQAALDAAGQALDAQALVVWRGICLSNTSGSKAEFAHALTAKLEQGEHSDFAVPKYISDALKFATKDLPDAG